MLDTHKLGSAVEIEVALIADKQLQKDGKPDILYSQELVSCKTAESNREWSAMKEKRIDKMSSAKQRNKNQIQSQTNSEA